MFKILPTMKQSPAARWPAGLFLPLVLERQEMAIRPCRRATHNSDPLPPATPGRAPCRRLARCATARSANSHKIADAPMCPPLRLRLSPLPAGGAVSYRGGGVVLGIGSANAPALRAEIQMGSSIQRSCDTTYFVFTDVCPNRRQTVPRRCAACAQRDSAVCGHVARLRNIPTSVFSHAQTHPQKSCRQPAGSLRDRRLAAPRTNRSPQQRVCRHGLGQRRQPRRSGSLVLLVARSRPTAGLHLAERVAWLAHAAPLPAMAAPTPVRAAASARCWCGAQSFHFAAPATWT